MRASQFAELLTLTIGLILGLSGVATISYDKSVMTNWDANRCVPGVAATAGRYKPDTDPRTPSQFASDNWTFCQKQYVQEGIRAAAKLPQEVASELEGVVNVADDLVEDMGDLFYDLWQFVYQAYSGFMDQMKGGAKLFHNFMIQLHSIVGKLQASALSIVYGLISLTVAFVSSVQLVLIVAIVIIGILIALQIILFFLLLPISGMIITITAIISVTVVSIATAIAAATVAEMFSPGVCFVAGTPVLLRGGLTQPIESLSIGAVLGDGGCVTAVHHFWSSARIYDLYGVRVTGDHLVVHPETPRHLVPVSDHPDARLEPMSLSDVMGVRRDLWCLTTSRRRIPVLTSSAGAVLFADWEEIPDGDTEALQEWYSEVWAILNPASDIPRPVSRVLEAEAGLSPDCYVPMRSWMGIGALRKRACDVRLGDWIYDASGEPTEVMGIVRLAVDPSSDVVELPEVDGEDAEVSMVTVATWVHSGGLWRTTAGVRCKRCLPATWIHFYTTAGSFRIGSRGGQAVRDASEVGLDRLKAIVDSVVLTP